jgi:hypothetical protein
MITSTIFVTLQGAVAEVDEATLPEGVTVEIIDFHNFKDNPTQEARFLSHRATDYLRRHLAEWGRRELLQYLPRVQRSRPAAKPKLRGTP